MFSYLQLYLFHLMWIFIYSVSELLKGLITGNLNLTQLLDSPYASASLPKSSDYHFFRLLFFFPQVHGFRSKYDDEFFTHMQHTRNTTNTCIAVTFFHLIYHRYNFISIKNGLLNPVVYYECVIIPLASPLFIKFQLFPIFCYCKLYASVQLSRHICQIITYKRKTT